MSQIPSFREVLLPNRVDPRSSRNPQNERKARPVPAPQPIEETPVADEEEEKPAATDGSSHLDLTA